MGLLLHLAVVADVFAKKGSPRPPANYPPPDFNSGGSRLSIAPIPLLMVLAFALIAGLIVYLSYQAKQRRKAGFIEMATQLGLTYSPVDSMGLLGYPFALFQRGDGRGIENVLYGDWQETHVIAFDYWYYDETSDGKSTSRTYHRFDCVIVPVEADCVRLEIGHETFFSKLAGALSFHDQQFESDAFNDAFKVSCDDAKFASDLIDARMMQWLLANGADYGFELIGNRVLVAGPKVDPVALTALLGVGRGFVQHVPKVVYSLYPG
jgi:hypothetical protein